MFSCLNNQSIHLSSEIWALNFKYFWPATGNKLVFYFVLINVNWSFFLSMIKLRIWDYQIYIMIGVWTNPMIRHHNRLLNVSQVKTLKLLGQLTILGVKLFFIVTKNFNFHKITQICSNSINSIKVLTLFLILKCITFYLLLLSSLFRISKMRLPPFSCKKRERKRERAITNYSNTTRST